MVAVAEIVGAEAKMDAYLARLPKRDRRELSRASPQTRWIIDAVGEWYAFYQERASGLGLPSENTLHRAGLMIPRAPMTNGLPQMADPPARAAAVEAAMPKIQDSRRRVLIANERRAHVGLEAVAKALGMRYNEAKDYLAEARSALANILRGMGWDVPHDE
jgi:hypothetical protein